MLHEVWNGERPRRLVAVLRADWRLWGAYALVLAGWVVLRQAVLGASGFVFPYFVSPLHPGFAAFGDSEDLHLIVIRQRLSNVNDGARDVAACGFYERHSWRGTGEGIEGRNAPVADLVRARRNGAARGLAMHLSELLLGHGIAPR